MHEEVDSMIYMVANQALWDGMREARSASWSFYSSDERQCRPPAKALPGRVSRHWRCCFSAHVQNNDQRLTQRPQYIWPVAAETRLIDIIEAASNFNA